MGVPIRYRPHLSPNSHSLTAARELVLESTATQHMCINALHTDLHLLAEVAQNTAAELVTGLPTQYEVLQSFRRVTDSSDHVRAQIADVVSAMSALDAANDYSRELERRE
jgi:hypothetical protein